MSKFTIDRDIDTYTNEVEYCTLQLQRAEPKKERYWQNRRTAARIALQALIRLRGVMGLE